MWAIKMTYINKNSRDMQWQLPKIIWQNKWTHKKYACMLYNETRPLYMETGVSDVGFGAGLL